MTLQQVDGERVVDIHYHKGEQVSTQCVNDSGCKQLKTSYSGEAQQQKKGRSTEMQLVALSYSIVWWMPAAQCSTRWRCKTIVYYNTLPYPTLDRLRLHSIVSYIIVLWIQAAQASYSGKAGHHMQGKVCHHKQPYPRPA